MYVCNSILAMRCCSLALVLIRRISDNSQKIVTDATKVSLHFRSVQVCIFILVLFLSHEQMFRYSLMTLMTLPAPYTTH